MVGDDLLGGGVGESDPTGQLFEPRRALPLEGGPAVVEVGEFRLLPFERGVIDRASVDAVVSVPNAPDVRYWLFLERRDGAWLIAGTLELGQ